MSKENTSKKYWSFCSVGFLLFVPLWEFYTAVWMRALYEYAPEASSSWEIPLNTVLRAGVGLAALFVGIGLWARRPHAFKLARLFCRLFVTSHIVLLLAYYVARISFDTFSFEKPASGTLFPIPDFGALGAYACMAFVKLVVPVSFVKMAIPVLDRDEPKSDRLYKTLTSPDNSF